jgi:esterase/lipase superfamily enzyme
MRHSGTLYSRHLGIDVAYAWYGSCGAPVVLPTSGGNHLENEDRGLVDALMPKIAAGETSSRCASRASTATLWQRKDLHAAERLRRHDLWDAFLAEEFLPFVRAMAPAGKLTVYGRVDGRRITP